MTSLHVGGRVDTSFMNIRVKKIFYLFVVIFIMLMLILLRVKRVVDNYNITFVFELFFYLVATLYVCMIHTYKALVGPTSTSTNYLIVACRASMTV